MNQEICFPVLLSYYGTPSNNHLYRFFGKVSGENEVQKVRYKTLSYKT